MRGSPVLSTAGGSASVVVDNTSTNIDATSGESRFANTDAFLVGLSFASGTPLTIP